MDKNDAMRDLLNSEEKTRLNEIILNKTIEDNLKNKPQNVTKKTDHKNKSNTNKKS